MGIEKIRRERHPRLYSISGGAAWTTEDRYPSSVEWADAAPCGSGTGTHDERGQIDYVDKTSGLKLERARSLSCPGLGLD